VRREGRENFMDLTEDEAAGFPEKIDFVDNKGQGGQDGDNSCCDEAFITCNAGVGEGPPSEDQRDGDPGEDDDLVKKFEGHG